jgi:hypothetical protein
MISAYEHRQNAARRPFDAGTTQWREWRDGFMACRP